MNVIRFLRQVREEISKVVWATRAEVITTTIMVVIMALLFAIVFFLADQVFSYAVNLLLGL